MINIVLGLMFSIAQGNFQIYMKQNVMNEDYYDLEIKVYQELTQSYFQLLMVFNETLCLDQNLIEIEELEKDLVVTKYCFNGKITGMDTTKNMKHELNIIHFNNLTLPYDNRMISCKLNMLGLEETFYFSRTPVFIILKTTTQSQISSQKNDLSVFYSPKQRNHITDIIALQFQSEYYFNLSFSICLGIKNLSKNLKCWIDQNMIYVQQNTQDFVENINHEDIEFQLVDFKNPYFVGRISIGLKIKNYNQKEEVYFSSSGSASIITTNMKTQQMILKVTENQINKLSNITIKIPVEVFQKYLQLKITFPNFQDTYLTFVNSDENISMEVIKSIDFQQYILKLTTIVPLYNQNIELELFNYRNPKLPVTVIASYILTEIFYESDNYLEIQCGTNQIEFIKNTIELISILSASQTILAQDVDVQLILKIDYIQQDQCKILFQLEILILEFSSELKINKIYHFQNYIIIGNRVTIFDYQLANGQLQSVFLNVNNPGLPGPVDYVKVFIQVQNRVVAQSENQISLQFYPGIISISQSKLSHIFSNQHSIFEIQIMFDFLYDYQTNFIIYFDLDNIDLSKQNTQMLCFIDDIQYNCQINDDKLIVFKVIQKHQLLNLKIENLTYPRSLGPLIINSIKQINLNNIIINYSEEVLKIIPNSCRKFEDFSLTSAINKQLNNEISLQLNFSPKQKIYQDEYLILEYKFIEIKHIQCRAESYGIVLQCSQSDKFIRINVFAGELNAQTSYQLIQLNFELYTDLAHFEIKSYTKDNYLAQYANYDLIFQENILSRFPLFIFDPVSQNQNKVDNYYLSFENSITIPENGYLILSGNSSINILESDLQNSLGKEKIVEQSIVKINETYGIQYIFSDPIERGQHTFLIRNVINPPFVEMETYFTFSLYSYDQQNNLLEFEQYILLLDTHHTQENCLLFDESNYCKLCQNPFLTFQGACVIECPNGTVLENVTCKSCNYPQNCLQCSSTDQSICSQCGSPFELKEGICLKKENIMNQNNNQAVQQNQTISNQTISDLKNEKSQNNLAYDTDLLGLILVSVSILTILQNIIKGKSDFNNLLLFISGFADFTLQFSFLIFAFLNYNATEGILSIFLWALSNSQQILAFHLFSKQLSQDSYYSNLILHHFSLKIYKILLLLLDWKIIYIHKSSVTTSIIHQIEFSEEKKFIQNSIFLLKGKIIQNFINISTGIILLNSQEFKAMFTYQFVFYQIAMIFIQINKILLTQLVNNQQFLQNGMNQNQHNRLNSSYVLITAKVQPEKFDDSKKTI